MIRKRGSSVQKNKICKGWPYTAPHHSCGDNNSPDTNDHNS
jgi:hypothetical protein